MNEDAVLRKLEAQSNALFAVLDASATPTLVHRLASTGLEHRSLYEGGRGPALASVAPYLVKLPKGAPLLEEMVREGWDRSLGIYLTSPHDFEEVRRHVRRFLRVQIEGVGEALFRFYDPRILRAFLPTCDAAQLEALFEKVEAYLMEDDEPGQVVRFALAYDSGKGKTLLVER